MTDQVPWTLIERASGGAALDLRRLAKVAYAVLSTVDDLPAPARDVVTAYASEEGVAARSGELRSGLWRFIKSTTLMTREDSLARCALWMLPSADDELDLNESLGWLRTFWECAEPGKASELVVAVKEAFLGPDA